MPSTMTKDDWRESAARLRSLEEEITLTRALLVQLGKLLRAEHRRRAEASTKFDPERFDLSEETFHARRAAAKRERKQLAWNAADAYKRGVLIPELAQTFGLSRSKIRKLIAPGVKYQNHPAHYGFRDGVLVGDDAPE